MSDDPKPLTAPITTLPATMTGLGKLKPEPGIWQMTAPVPECGPDDVLIRVTHTAICGTDVHIYNWDDWASKTVPVPMITGHEFAGEIVQIGARVTRDLRIGQHVSGEGHIVNMNSEAARMGRFHLDPDTQGVGVNRPGCFAPYLSLPAFNVVPLPDRVSNELGAVLDPFGNAVHTVQQTDVLGRDVLVTGAGPIGIMAASVAKFAGARSVTVTDINPYRLDLAAKMADVRTVNVAHEDLHDVRRELGIINGYDVAMEMSGARPAIPQAIAHLRMGGELTLLGIPAGEASINWSDVIMKAI
ncbi:MAG: L-threonine 3-dehydrogenase, partial [Asticcacaulis sp.]